MFLKNNTTSAGTIYFFTNSIPIDENGSFIVFRRHLLPLVKKGWELKIFSYCPPPAEDVWWTHIHLPHRLPWWPPTSLHIPWSVDLQTALMLRHLRKTGHLQATDGPRLLLGTFWDHQGLIAAKLADSGWAPLGMFLHDDEVNWGRDSGLVPHLTWRRKRMADSAHWIWSVSDRLTSQLPSCAKAKTRLLRPIPGTDHARTPEWKDHYAKSVHLGYAGKVYPGLGNLISTIARQLQLLGGRMTIITDRSTAAAPPLESSNLDWLPYFEKADQAMSWLQNNCSALLVAHPLSGDTPPGEWNALKNSFPSKLIEYSRLGLPVILAGDPDSELGDWARQNPEIPFLDNHTPEGFTAVCSALMQPDSWLAAARSVHRLSEVEFGHQNIQNAFLEDINQMIPTIHEPRQSRD